jgi:hypothetical protein
MASVSSIITNIKAVAKPIVAFLGLALTFLNENYELVPDQWKQYVTALIALGTLAGIYRAPHGQLTFVAGRHERKARRDPNTRA